MIDVVYVVGIVVVFFVSNEGLDLFIIGDLLMENWDMVCMFFVGVINGNFLNLFVVDFFSCGFIVCGGEGSLLIKFEVFVLGVVVCFVLAGGEYGILGGIFMVVFYVSGVLFLFKEVFLNFLGEVLMFVFYYICIDLGIFGEDNNYGMGVISLFVVYEYFI